MQTGRHAAQTGREANRQAYAEQAGRGQARKHRACRGSRRAEEQAQTGRKEKGTKMRTEERE